MLERFTPLVLNAGAYLEFGYLRLHAVASRRSNSAFSTFFVWSHRSLFLAIRRGVLNGFAVRYH
jgi:hypothetical protein